MPQYQRPFMKGHLIIHFNVKFPDPGFISLEKSHILNTVLQSKPSKPLPDKVVAQCEEVTLVDVNIKEEMKQKERRRKQEAYDEEDDDDDTLPQLSCNQQ